MKLGLKVGDQVEVTRNLRVFATDLGTQGTGI